MDDSLRCSSSRDANTVGFSFPGGALVVYFESQRISLMVVSCLAISRAEREEVDEREEDWRGIGCAVVRSAQSRECNDSYKAGVALSNLSSRLSRSAQRAQGGGGKVPGYS